MAAPKPYQPTNVGWGAGNFWKDPANAAYLPASARPGIANPAPAWTDPRFAGPQGGLGAGDRTERSGRMVNPDYSGILGSFTADARARFGAGQAANQAQRMSRAKAAINKLGVRDVPGMLEKLQAYGLTQADLQGAADNPWSELKGIDFNAKRAWQGAVAQNAAQGLYRSGATVGARQDIDRTKAMQEAGLTQETLGELSEGLFGQQEWERQQRDQMEQAIASQQSSLASAYQPYWQWD